MSVYHGVRDTELAQCLASLAAQTRQPDQTVIVVDGPVPESLLLQLKDFKVKQTQAVELVELKENRGLIHALNTGLQHCRGEWLIRMDADDIALPHRLELQLTTIESNPDLDVLGSAMLEFEDDPRNPVRLKPVLQSHDEIRAGLPLRNPINHPTACIRRASLDAIGGYPSLPLLEDYYLWSQLLVNGAKFQNLPEPLHLFRFDDATLGRRAGAGNFRNEIWLRYWMYQKQIISYPRYCLFVLIQSILRFAPLSIRRLLWNHSRKPFAAKILLPDTI